MSIRDEVMGRIASLLNGSNRPVVVTGIIFIEHVENIYISYNSSTIYSLPFFFSPPLPLPSLPFPAFLPLGHSLGGALGMLFGYDLMLHHKSLWRVKKYKNAPLVQIMTFGSPRVGNPAFRYLFININL